MIFFDEWLGIHGGREVLIVFDARQKEQRDRLFIETSQQLQDYVKEYRQQGHPAFISVQPYTKRNQVLGLEKLFFDFDHKSDPQIAWKEAQDFALSLEQYYNINPLVVFSGKKGYHVYVWLKEIITGFPNTTLMKAVYKDVCRRLLTGFNFETVDTQVFEIKRLARVPYSRHIESKRSCVPVRVNDGTPFRVQSLEPYKLFGLETQNVETVYKEVIWKARYKDAKKKKKQNWMFTHDIQKNNKIRPCIQKLIDEAKTIDFELPHRKRFAIALECIATKWSDNAIISIFSQQKDFDEDITQDQIKHAREYITEENEHYKPFKCETLRDELNICFKDCPIKKKTKTKGVVIV